MTNQRISESASQRVNQPPNSPTSQLPGLAVVGRWLLLIGLLAAAGGASFAPWVDRPPAALVLTAPDLAEFVKFLPEVRGGSLTVRRLLFLLPLFTTAFSLPLLVAAGRLGYPRWVRWPALAAVVPLSLTLLPPVWSPGVLLSAEFRLQTAACTLCLGVVAAARRLRHVPTGPPVVLLVLSSLASPALALWQFFVAQKAIARAYASSIIPGWGAWITIIGFALTIFGALFILRGLYSKTPPADRFSHQKLK